jgi:hypothetical protein
MGIHIAWTRRWLEEASGNVDCVGFETVAYTSS